MCDIDFLLYQRAQIPKRAERFRIPAEFYFPDSSSTGTGSFWPRSHMIPGRKKTRLSGTKLPRQTQTSEEFPRHPRECAPPGKVRQSWNRNSAASLICTITSLKRGDVAVIQSHDPMAGVRRGAAPHSLLRAHVAALQRWGRADEPRVGSDGPAEL